MTPEQAALGRNILRALPGRPVVLGTFGLALHGALDAAHAADVDVLCTLEEVPAVAAALLAHGFRVTSWQDELHAAPALELLRGRIYLRGARDGVVVDVTYEGVDVALWQSDAVSLDGIRVATVERIVALKRVRNADKDRRILALLRGGAATRGIPPR